MIQCLSAVISTLKLDVFKIKMEACIFGHRKVIELLVDNGADVSAKDRFGFTPLSIAKKNNYTDIVQYLKGKGATR